MGIDLNELLNAQMGRGLERMANGFDQDARLLNNIAANQFGSTDVMDAAAAKELSKAGMPTDIAGLNTANKTPNP